MGTQLGRGRFTVRHRTGYRTPFSPLGNASSFLTLLLSAVLIFMDVHVAHLIKTNSSKLFRCYPSWSPGCNLIPVFL